jgi:hypothetical protein
MCDCYEINMFHYTVLSYSVVALLVCSLCLLLCGAETVSLQINSCPLVYCVFAVVCLLTACLLTILASFQPMLR